MINLEYVYKHCADPDCVRRLNEITDRSGAKIVVSSSWRDDPRIVEVLRGWGVEGEIIGITPRIESIIRGASVLYMPTRGEEIAAWINRHWEENGLFSADGRLLDPFVILDDDSDMGELGFALVHTEFEIGLTDSHVQDALVMLE